MMLNEAKKIINKYYPEGSVLRDIYLRHCESVARLAGEINSARHLGLDPQTVDTAAMLHYIGICMTDAAGIHCHGKEPYIRHGIVGAELLRRAGLPEIYARVAERHTGAGITTKDVTDMNLPLPVRDYTPETQLERLICYADKFYSKTRLDSSKPLEAVRASMMRHSPETLARFDLLHKEFSEDGA